MLSDILFCLHSYSPVLLENNTETTTDTMHSGKEPNPNISKQINTVAKGHLVTLLNIAAIPIAAPTVISNPKHSAKTPPRVAPMLNEGTISPPFNPADTVMTVNNAFSKKSYQLTLL